MLGGRDRRVSPHQGLELYRALKSRNTPVRYKHTNKHHHLIYKHTEYSYYLLIILIDQADLNSQYLPILR